MVFGKHFFTIGNAAATQAGMAEEHSYFTVCKAADTLQSMVDGNSYFQGSFPAIRKESFITIGKTADTQVGVSGGHFTIGKTAASLGVITGKHYYFTISKTAASLRVMTGEHSYSNFWLDCS